MKNIFKIIFICFLTGFNIETGNAQGVKEKILSNNKAHDRYASYSPDEKKIIFESNREGKWNIYLMNSDGTNQERLTFNKNNNRRPTWHPSGKSILFESIKNGKSVLYVIDLYGKKTKTIKIKEPEGIIGFARYSPNGKMIAFTLTETDQKSNIAVVNNEGGDFRFITDNNFRSFYPFWSPDGKSIMFSSRHDTNNEDDEIYRIFLNGNDPLRITQWPKHNFCASWSTDGEKIAYVTSMENTRPEIYIMNANGENQIRITFNEEGDTLPHWSPDNKKLLITGFRNDNYEIVELDVSDIIR